MNQMATGQVSLTLYDDELEQISLALYNRVLSLRSSLNFHLDPKGRAEVEDLLDANVRLMELVGDARAAIRTSAAPGTSDRLSV